MIVFSRFIAEEISSHLLRKMRTVKGETKEENVQSAPLHENIRIQQGGAYGLVEKETKRLEEPSYTL